MKTLLILRHGKAENQALGGDRDRALTERGERDSAAMGRQIQALTGCPDAIITSDARRARQTTDSRSLMACTAPTPLSSRAEKIIS